MTSQPDLSRLTVRGPFWTATVRVVELDAPERNVALRALFLDAAPRRLGAIQGVHAPNVLIALCRVDELRITPTPATLYRWSRPPAAAAPMDRAGIAAALANGSLSLLLLQADPSAQGDLLGELTCLNGEIALDPLTPDPGVVAALYAAVGLQAPSDERFAARPTSGPAALPGRISAHASGITLYGAAELPWQPAPIWAPFQIAREFPDPAADPRRFRLSPEIERLDASERRALLAAWADLSLALNPRYPLNRPAPNSVAPAPQWATLEIVNPGEPPRMFWPITPWGRRERLRFDRGELNLLLSDRSPYDQQALPGSLARAVPESVAIGRDGDLLEVVALCGPRPPIGAVGSSLNYQYSAAGEALTIQEVTTAFSPTEVAGAIRAAQNLPEPFWPGLDEAGRPLGVIEPPVVWGCFALEDGWAHLPVPNLSEQVYLDTRLAQRDPDAIRSEPPRRTLQGALNLGNQARDGGSAVADEQPWALTLVDAAGIAGRWVLEGSAPTTTLRSVELNFSAPDLRIEGLLWLSVEPPTVNDALPTLADWLTALRGVSLRSIGEAGTPAELFPAPVALQVHTLTVTPATTPLEEEEVDAPALARLGDWSASYRAHNPLIQVRDGATTREEPLYSRLQAAGVFPPDLFSRHRPLVWRRHPTLPMVQALPLTQSRTPPNAPSPSRQYVPFELEVAADPAIPALDPQAPLALPFNWRFSAAPSAAERSSAATWPRLAADTQVRPAREWRTQADLTLVALSLPGLILDPRLQAIETGLIEPGLALGAQYRHDVPLTDQIQALAQPPPDKRDPARTPPLVAEPPAEPAQPLTRATLGDYWRRLSEQASLAALDAVAALARHDGALAVEGLVEPLTWPVTPSLDTTRYPGALRLSEAGGAELVLHAAAKNPDPALAGINAAFVIEGATMRLAPDADTADVHLVAGSAPARLDDGHSIDQRGLRRSHTQTVDDLMVTPISLAGATVQAYDLVSSRTALKLTIPNASWQFWFHNVPVAAAGFSRAAVRSPQVADANDPEALSAAFQALQGYEWRLAVGEMGAVATICGLEFYPLALEKLTLTAGAVTELVISGRLQLPLSADPHELADLDNVVELTFGLPADGLQLPADGLQLTAVALAADAAGEWPLALGPGGELIDAPRIHWTSVRYVAAPTPQIVIDPAHLEFELFETTWRYPIASGTLAFGATAKPLVEVALPDNDWSIALSGVELTLASVEQLTAVGHTLTVDVALHLGRLAVDTVSQPTLKLTARYDLLGATPGAIYVADQPAPQLFSHLALQLAPPQGASVQSGRIPLAAGPYDLAFTWNGAVGATLTPPELLPGMPLDLGSVRGAATVSFAVSHATPNKPALTLRGAFIDAVLSCRWGQASAPSEQVYAASAGDLLWGYNAGWDAATGEWTQHVLVSGVLDITGLISWPEPLELDPDSGLITLPPVRDATGSAALDHQRHSLRVMFNQHALPPELLIANAGADLLFLVAPGQVWQFLAVVAHTVVAVGGAPANPTLSRPRTWTVVQEVRLLRSATLQEFITTLGADRRTIAPDGRVTALDAAVGGFLAPELRAPLLAALAALPAELLLVEASAHHWRRVEPLEAEQTQLLSPTALQYLPGGSLHALLSGPADFSAAEWRLLSLPFLGRLHPAVHARVELAQTPEAATEPLNPLLVDPILALHSQAQTPAAQLDPLALALANRAADQPLTLAVAALDSAAWRTWRRLDPLSLEENWFRLQTPPPEPIPTQLPGITAALPDTPARLSRSTALRRAFDVFRPAYPPALPPAAAPQPGDESVLSYVPPPEVQNATLVWQPRALFVSQAVVGRRVQRGLLALYTFQEAAGARTVRDVSGVGPELPLTIRDSNRVAWLPGGGVRLTAPNRMSSAQAATKLFDGCRATNAITIEAWVRPANVTQRGPARIVSLSADTNRRNFTLGQGLRDTALPADVYEARLRTQSTSVNGRPALASTAGTARVELTHLVFTRASDGTATLYINGEAQAPGSYPTPPGEQHYHQGQILGTFQDWDATFRLHLGNELTDDRSWLGEYYLVAIYNQALSAAEVRQNYAARQSAEARYAWLLGGLLLAEAPAADSAALRRYPAATLLPARSNVDVTYSGRRNGKDVLRTERQPNPMPLGFAISPYLSLDVRPKPSAVVPRLSYAELLCVEAVDGTPRALAGRVWDLTAAEPPDDATISAWAREQRRRLAPAAPLALVRLREVFAAAVPEAGAAALITNYRFLAVGNLEQPPMLRRRVPRLRTAVRRLRFREGQFGGDRLPATIHPVELAPPQITGFQPLRLAERLDNAATWPWGFSGLRLQVRYALAGMVGPGSAPNAAGDPPASLWWQAIQHNVQYRSSVRDQVLFHLTAQALPEAGPLSDALRNALGEAGLILDRTSVVLPGSTAHERRIVDPAAGTALVVWSRAADLAVSRAPGPAAGLPPLFRARAIKSLLPVLSQPPLPQRSVADLLQRPGERWPWQPVLPHALRVLLIGARAGAMLAVRPQIITQRDQAPTLVSSSVPAQHRVPRPVLLPANRPDQPDTALQTWAGSFEPTVNALVSAQPVDEAYYAACGDKPARSVRVIITNIPRGIAPHDWDGALELTITQMPEPPAERDSIEVALLIGGERFAYSQDGGNGRYLPTPTSGANPNDTPPWRERFNQLPSGAPFSALVTVKPAVEQTSFAQTLSFTLYRAADQRYPLPLEAYLIHFEDPEYNRRLASQTAKSERLIKLTATIDAENDEQVELVHALTIAADRRSYNPTTQLALRYDWDVDQLNRLPWQATIKLERLGPAGEVTPLPNPNGFTSTLAVGNLRMLDLSRLRLGPDLALRPGDSLRITLSAVRITNSADNPSRYQTSGATVQLLVPIVAEPVTPTPEAAYALLRRDVVGDREAIGCVRFAWAPEADRIDLVCADDLRREVVRRRAVFRWRDIVRPGRQQGYAIQKIAQNGATHFPLLP